VAADHSGRNTAFAISGRCRDPDLLNRPPHIERRKLDRRAAITLPFKPAQLRHVLTPKVLIVNDDSASLLALETVLAGASDSASRGRDYEIITARSGHEALRQVLHHDFAVIILDVSMPGMDGFETAEAIHSHPRSSSVPIIFVTAYYADEINKLKGYQEGAVDYLFTPVIPQILQSKVAVFVELAKQRIELMHKTRQLEELNQDLRVQRMRDLERINAALEVEIAERRQAEQRAHELATRDPLTKLANRRSLIERLQHGIANADRHDEHLALLFLDLDKFKSINDTLGHEVGDGLLVEVAARLNAAVRNTDMAARLGGDEFVVLLEGLPVTGGISRVAKKIVQSLAQPYEIGMHTVWTSASVGIAIYPQDGDSAQVLLKNADMAMYHVKKQKRGTIQFFHEELNQKMMERAQFEHELHQAVERKEFELYYQPKVQIASGNVSGVEALLRWRHPRLGLLPAEQFISAAADHRLLAPIGEWVIANACAQVRRWLDSGIDALSVPVAVNITVPELQPGFPGAIRELLKKHGVPPCCLQLEITESLLVRDLDRVSSVMQEISDSGITIAIDDFGTGYSSLSLLKTLPIDILKIDQSFVRDLSEEPGETAIVSAIISMARALALRVVAEGVENETQLSLLRSLGCDEYQGYYHSRPLAADDLMNRLPETKAG
jgi:diguanylate cyclase (GGDEF)-like protein